MLLDITETVSVKTEFHALITTPSGFDPNQEALPMIVFLHGSGDGENVTFLKRHGIPKYFSADPDHRGLRVITLSPRCPAGVIWDNVLPQLFELICRVATEYRVDQSRISVTGLSMGGFGTWGLLLRYPAFFSAAAPICGGGVDWLVTPNISTPIRAFHGEADDDVPVVYSQILCDRINKNGGHAELTRYSDVGHHCWELAYEKTDLIEWLASSCKDR